MYIKRDARHPRKVNSNDTTDHAIDGMRITDADSLLTSETMSPLCVSLQTSVKISSKQTSRKRKTWEPHKGEIFPPPFVHKKVGRVQMQENLSRTALRLLDLEASISKPREHAASIDIRPVMKSVPESLSEMEIFGTFIHLSSLHDSLAMLKGSFTEDERTVAVSEIFALLATAPKEAVIDFISSRTFDFRKVAMATAFQQKVRFGCYFLHPWWISAPILTMVLDWEQVQLIAMRRNYDVIEVAEAMFFVGTGGGFRSKACESVACIVYSPAVDSILWRREYPHDNIMRALRTCNMVASECPYDFCGDESRFRLWQSINAYIVCRRAGVPAGLEAEDGALWEAVGIKDWMSVPSNRRALEIYAAKWDEFAEDIWTQGP
jgi:hypothetical protein